MYRVTEDGVVHRWPRGQKEPPEVRRDICPECLKQGRGIQKLKIVKTEFPGKLGKIHRDYVCQVCGYKGRTVRRQRVKTTRDTLKEPEQRKTK